VVGVELRVSVSDKTHERALREIKRLREELRVCVESQVFQMRKREEAEAEVERLRDVLVRVEANTYDDGLRQLVCNALAEDRP
jgi:hypothetical protein